LVSPLGISYVLLELLVKLIKVSDKVLGMSRSDVALGVNSNVSGSSPCGIEGVIPVVALGMLLYANSVRVAG